MDKMKDKAPSEITDEELHEFLESLGWEAGRGDSPYTQEFYEELNGLDKKKKEGEE